MRYGISWHDSHFHSRVCGYVVYASRDRRQLGRKVVEVCRDERYAVFEISEGYWWLTVLQKYTDCSIEEWRRVKREPLHATGRETPPSAVASGCVGAIDPGMSGMVLADPPGDDEPASITQVIEGEAGHPEHGKLVHQEPEYAHGVLQEMGRTSGIRFPLDDHVAAPASAAHRKVDRTLFVQRVGVTGALGDATEVSQVLPERHGFMEVLLAEVDTNLGTSTGFTAPTAADMYEHDPVGGFRTKRLPQAGDTAGWAPYGSVGGPSSFASMGHLTPYVQEAWVPTDVQDLGSDQVFIVECADSVRRPKVSPGPVSEPFLDAPVDSLSYLPMMPENLEAHHNDPRDFGPHYLMREFRQSGLPARPLRHVRWEVRTSQSLPITGEAWKPYIPGQWHRGRYVQVRLRLFDETGWSQVISGDVSVRARIPRRVYSGQVAWAAPGVPYPGVTVTLPVHPITGGALFPNQMHVVATAQGLGGVASIVTVGGAGAGAAGFTIMVWAAGGGTQTAAEAVDYIVTGY